MAAQSTIQIVVDESGASAGFTRLQRNAVSSFDRTAAAVRQTRVELQAVATQGTTTGNAVAAGMDKANSHALSSLDTVRLFRDDLGIRVPRAMEKLIASTQAFQVIAQGAFGVFAFVGVVELLDTIGNKIKEVGHYLAGDTKEVQDLRKALIEANEAALVNPVNRSQAENNQTSINNEIALLQKKKKTSEELMSVTRGASLVIPGMPVFSDEDEKKLARFQQMSTDLMNNRTKLNREQNDEERRMNNETAAAAVEGYRKLAQERKNAYTDVDARVTKLELSPADAARQKREIDAKYSIDLVNLTRETARQTTEIWQQATLAKLQGENKARQESILAQQNYAKDAARRGDPDVQGHVAAMEALYQEQKKGRLRQFQDETAKMTEQANAQELDGTKRLRQEEDNALADLLKLRVQRGEEGVEFDQMYSDRRFAIVQQTDAKLLQSTKQYLDQERAAHDAVVASSSHGYAQIANERQKQLDQAKQSYNKVTGGLDPQSQEKSDADKAYARTKVDIEAQSNQRIMELNRKNNDETLQLEDQAMSVRSGHRRDGLLGVFHDEQQQTARILAEYDKRERSLKEKIDDHLISEKDAASQQLAIEDLKNNQLAEQQQSFQDRIANTLESSFRDPMGTIKSTLEHEFAELLANWLLQLTIFKTTFGTTMGGLSVGSASSGAAGQGVGGILGGILSRTKSSRPDGLPDFSHASVAGYGGASPAGSTFAASRSTAGIGSGSIGSALHDLGGLPGYDVAGRGTVAPGTASPSSTYGVDNGSGSTVSVPDFGTTAQSDTITAPTLGLYDQAATTSTPYADNGEDGGFAGYLTGSTDDMSLAQASRDDSQYLNPINSTATQQASSAGSSFASGATSLLGVAGAGLAAYSAVGTTVNAYKSGNVLQGALGDAAAGAAIGSIIPGVGTVIGAGVGALVGGASALIGMIGGEGSKLAARDYYQQSIFPALEAGYNDPSTDFQSAISNANKTAAEGVNAMRGKFGNAAAEWVDDNYVKKELTRVTSRIADSAQGGRMYTTLSAAQFHTGTDGISDFGDLWTSPTEGFVHAELGEGVVRSMAMSSHRPYVNAMNNGATPAEMAQMYLGNTSRTTAAPVSAGGDNHFHVHTLDTKTMAGWLKTGGAQLITKHQNDFAGQYAGDGISG